MFCLDDEMRKMGLFTEEDDETVVYQCDHLNPDYKFVLSSDIYTCAEIVSGKELAMIEFFSPDMKGHHFVDFLFLTKTGAPSSDSYTWEKAFYSNEDPFQEVERKAEELMSIVQDQEMETELTPEVRNIITDYLKQGDNANE